MTFSALTLVIFAALSATSFMFGWVGRRVLATRREADLQRNVYEAKGAVPQLESALRNRESRITTLQNEAQSLRDRLTAVEATQSQKDLEIVKKDREIRMVRSELQIVKDGTVDGDPAMLDDADSGETPSGDPAHNAAMKKLESRYESLKRGLIQRDDRIAELETQLAGGQGKATALKLELEREELQDANRDLETALASKDAVISDLQNRLGQESEQRELLEALAKRRADANRGLKDTAAKLEVQLPKLMDTLKVREETIAARDGTIGSLRADLTREMTEKTAHAATIVELQAAIAARREELVRQTAQIESLKTQHGAQLESLRAQQAAQTEAAKQQHVAQLQAAREQHAAQLESTRTQHVTQLEAARNKAVQLEQRMSVLTNDLALAQQQLADAHAQVQQRDSALNSQTQRALDADTRLRDQDDAEQSLRNELRARDTTIASLTEDIASLTANIAALTTENERLGSALSSPPPMLVERDEPTTEGPATTASAAVGESPAATANSSDENGVHHPAEMQFAAIHEHAAATERELHESVREVKALSRRVAELEAKRTSLEALLRDKDASLTERARRIEDQQDQLARLEARIDERNVEITALKRAQNEPPQRSSYTTPH